MAEQANDQQANENQQNDQQQEQQSGSESLSLLDGDGGGSEVKALDFSKGERPQEFPEEFWNAEKKAPDVDKLFGKLTAEQRRAEGLRVKLSKGEKITEGTKVEKADDYSLIVGDVSPEDKAAFEKIPADDPLMKVARDAALAQGMSKEAFAAVMTPLAKAILTAGDVAAKPPTPEEIKEYKTQEVAKLGHGGQKIVAALGAWKKEQVATGIMSKSDEKAFNELTETADGVRFMNKLMQRMGGQFVPHDVDVNDAASLADLEKKMSEAFKAGNEAEYNKYAAQVNQRKQA